MTPIKISQSRKKYLPFPELIAKGMKMPDLQLQGTEL